MEIWQRVGKEISPSPTQRPARQCSCKHKGHLKSYKRLTSFPGPQHFTVGTHNSRVEMLPYEVSRCPQRQKRTSREKIRGDRKD
jgi:hypothetical protein